MPEASAGQVRSEQDSHCARLPGLQLRAAASVTDDREIGGRERVDTHAADGVRRSVLVHQLNYLNHVTAFAFAQRRDQRREEIGAPGDDSAGSARAAKYGGRDVLYFAARDTVEIQSCLGSARVSGGKLDWDLALLSGM